MNLKELIELSDKVLANNNLKEAKNLLEKAIKINPNIFELYHKLGLINNNLGNFKDAIECFKKATLINPNFSAAFCNLGIVYAKLNNKNLAIKSYIKAIEIDPKNFKAYYNLGNFYLNNNDSNNAEKYYNLSIDIVPNNIYPYNNLFQIYDRSNNLKKLDEILDKAKNIFGINPIIQFFMGISEYRKDNYQKAIKIFEKLKLNKNDTPKNVLKANILAKCYDHIGNYNKAFKFFEISNQILVDAYKQNIDKKKYSNSIEKRTKFYSSANLKIIENNKYEETNSDPVFLIGFPRSGTTLLDTILRTHSSIEVLEEKPLVDKLINEIELIIDGDFSKLEKIEEHTIKELRLLYFETRKNFLSSQKNKIYIDKLPLNIIYIGEIKRIFPNSKFILALRNPYDSVLSCFMQPFVPNNAMSNFSNLIDSSKLYDQVMRLWSNYEEVLDLQVHTIKYEEIVNNFDFTIKDLLKFLKLDWNNELKEFYKTAEKRGIINTPSYNQVDKPLYNQSIGRWKNYEDKFFETKKILDKWVNKFNY
jgi:tetratricopeptide (TPR) repeat protein